MTKIKLVILFLVVIYFANCKIDPFTEGKLLYGAYCASCHMEDGTGLKGIYPPLNNDKSDILEQTSLACLIKNGLKVIENFRAPMPANPKLSEIQVSNIVNYVNTQFYNLPPSSIKMIRSQLANCGSNE